MAVFFHDVNFGSFENSYEFRKKILVMENRNIHDNDVNPLLSLDMITLVEVAGTFLHAAWKHASYFNKESSRSMHGKIS